MGERGALERSLGTIPTVDSFFRIILYIANNDLYENNTTRSFEHNATGRTTSDRRYRSSVSFLETI